MALNHKVTIPIWLMTVLVSIVLAAIAWVVNSSVMTAEVKSELMNIKEIQTEEKIKLGLNTATTAALTTSVAVTNQRLENIESSLTELKSMVKEIAKKKDE